MATENQAVEGDEEESLSNAGEEPNGPKWSVVVRQKMQQAGMYGKHSLRTPMLSGFRDYLFETLGVIHNKQEVENVARYLYFMDPVNVSMDFVTNIEKTNLFFNKLRELGLCNQTIFNYLKNLRRFIGYKTTATNVAANDPPLFQACVHFLNVTNAIRKKLSKGVSKERVVKRFNTLTTDSLQPEDCRRLLEVAKPEFLNCIHRASTAKTLTVKHQLNILYYLEALLILKHLQRPGVVANMTVEEWHKRVPHNFTSEGTSEKLVVVGVKHHKTATQVATFALTEVEERAKLSVRSPGQAVRAKLSVFGPGQAVAAKLSVGTWAKLGKRAQSPRLYKLRELGLCNKTIFNYLRNLRRFIGYKTTATNVAANDPPLFQACVHFLNVTNAIWKKLSKGVSKERVVKRFNTLTTDSLQPEDCRRLLEVAKPEFLNCIHRASTAKTLTVKHQLNILYYLEALLILKHLQRPGVVANMTVEEWHKRVPHNFTSEGTSEKLVVVGVKHHKTATQVATFALTEEEERWFDTYYTKVRPSMINEDAPEETFFISTSGLKIYNVSVYLRCFHNL
ncbi:uncharacterized protein LOC142109512 [Mixophyes fleayi]|uniref:uncharacterized protein LOC142109512 n=1 Tax=Mixophyes fleayi TaxID=3061075 RepID=UPI003F4DB1D2